MQRSCS